MLIGNDPFFEPVPHNTKTRNVQHIARHKKKLLLNKAGNLRCRVNGKDRLLNNNKTFFYEILHMKRKLISFAISAVILMVLLPDTFAFSEGIIWYSHDEGIANGLSKGKKIYINFHAVWCAPCKYMKKTTFSNPAVIAYLNEHFISIKIDVDKETKISRKYGASQIPDNWFLFKNGEIIGRRKGYIDPDMFMKILKSIQEDIGAKK